MTPEELILLLRQSKPASPVGSPACADDHQIAAYVDGSLGSDERIQLERHFADCEHCLDLIGILSRAREVSSASEITATLPRLQSRPNRKKWAGLLSGLAAAAVLVLAFAVLLDPTQTQVIMDSGGPRATRGAASSQELQVLTPAPGAVISTQQLVIRWTPVPGSLYYVVRIVTDAGQLVSEQRVTGTEWTPPIGLKLESGREYFVRVDAHPADLKSLSSSHVPFTIVNRP